MDRADCCTGIVKQAIAAQKIIPFYRYILKNDKQFETPAGALILHGIFTTVMIIVTVAASSSPDAYNLVLAIYTYGHVIIASKLPCVHQIFYIYHVERCKVATLSFSVEVITNSI